MSNVFKISGPIKVGSLPSAPSNPENGYIYFDSTLGTYQMFQGGAFRELNVAEVETLNITINDLVSLSGVNVNSTNLGSFTGNIIPDNETVKSALQSLETATENNSNDLSFHLNGGANKHDANEIDYERTDASKKNIKNTSDDVEAALNDLDDSIGALDPSPSNYTPADPSIVSNHLIAIDTALASAGLVSSVNGQTGDVVLSTDNISEGSTNLYFSDSRARTAAVSNSTAGNQIDQAPSVAAIKTYINTQADAKVADAIVDNVTTVAPSQNAVFDALTLKADVSSLSDYILLTQKGANNGVATLDSGGKVPVSQLPSSIMEYKGTWSAATNTPTLADGVGDAGDIYVNTAVGTVNFGSGSITFAAGDWVMYNGTIWQKSINSNNVVSVNGQTGVVVLNADDIEDTTTVNKFVTAAQKTLIDSAVQPGDNISSLNNDTGYIDAVSDDTNPSLGGNLSVGSFAIESASNPVLLAGQNAVRRAKQASKTSFVEEEYIHSITLTGSQTNSTISAFTFAYATYEGVEITYKIKQTTSSNVRIGTIRIVTNGTNVVLNDTYTDSADLGMSFSAAINGSNVEIRYTTGTNGGTMRADIKKFLT